MASDRLTKTSVDALETRASDYVAWDGELAGFGCRVRPSGAKSFIVQYRTGGRNSPVRKVTIGAHGKLTVEQARKAAREVLAKAELGEDVADQKAKARADITIAALADAYFEDVSQIKKPSTLLNDRSRIERHIKPLLGRKTVSAVTTADIERAMRDVAAGKTARNEKIGPRARSVVTGGKGAATQVVRLLSAMFAYAIRQHLRTDNPCAAVRKFPTQKMERFLTSSELEALGEAIREAETVGTPWTPDPAKKVKHAAKEENRRTILAPHAAAAIRLLLLTGARLREILHLEWSHVDFERGLLFLPDSKTGKKTIILNAPALALLADLPRIGRYVIAGERAGTPDEKPRSDLKRPWAVVSRRAGLDGVRLHDLRHTHASFGAGAGLGLPVIGRLLGHTQAATTARYAHLDADPIRRASDRIGGDIARAMGDLKSTGDVVPLRGSR